MAHQAKVGSISHGTLRTADLLRAFAQELKWLNEGQAIPLIVAEARGWADMLDAEIDPVTDHWAAEEVLQDLIDNYLSEYAPPFCYFGAHEGDGSDFGFWPDMDAIDELPKISDSNEIPEGGTGEDCVFVNDHGNVTVYNDAGEVVLELV